MTDTASETSAMGAGKRAAADIGMFLKERQDGNGISRYRAQKKPLLDEQGLLSF
ncbi:MAG TPA: hypothetical protein VEP69_02260 [Thermodesulfovibrionales bacterium]|nr:hypothetical protein [Thermodesulfovibrionales bacterium]